MPAEAVALDLYFADSEELESDVMDKIRHIISETGFQSDPHNKSMMAGTINFQPFENRQDNRDLLEECVQNIENEVSGLKISYEIKRNRDPGILTAKQCVIKVTNQN